MRGRANKNFAKIERVRGIREFVCRNARRFLGVGSNRCLGDRELWRFSYRLVKSKNVKAHAPQTCLSDKLQASNDGAAYEA
jgi:hypothetical protein